MLEGLTAINWGSLTHAYGSAGDVPDTIRALASPDPEEWVGALDGLYATLCHQCCTVYQATPPAVPFLLESLGQRTVRCRGGILRFLADAARATSFLAGHGYMAFYDKKRETGEFKEQLATEMEWVRQTRAAIWEGLDVYLDLLADLDKRLRIVVPYTLGLLIGFAANEMPSSIRKRKPFQLVERRLEQQLEEEPTELVRASLIFGLGCLVPHRQNARRILERQVKDRSTTKQCRLSAALSLSAHAPPLGEAVLVVLLDALKDPEETNQLFASDQPSMEAKHHPLAKAYRNLGIHSDDTAGTGFDADDVGEDEDFQFPWLEGWPTFTILKRLSQPGADYLDRVVPLVAPYLDRTNGFTIDEVARPILRLVFGDRKVTAKTRREDLTLAQAEVLQHLYDNLNLWATDSGNVDCVFGEFGLKHDRKHWRRLLGIKDAPLTDARIAEILATIVPDQQYSWEGPAIKRINLRQIGTAAFLPYLKQYPELEDLDLSSVPLSDADLSHLIGLKKLQKLYIPNTAITDAGIETLARLKNLRDLNLSCTRITDAALASLEKLTKLHRLSVWKVTLSERALKRFQKARPQCQVV